MSPWSTPEEAGTNYLDHFRSLDIPITLLRRLPDRRGVLCSRARVTPRARGRVNQPGNCRPPCRMPRLEPLPRCALVCTGDSHNLYSKVVSICQKRCPYVSHAHALWSWCRGYTWMYLGKTEFRARSDSQQFSVRSSESESLPVDLILQYCM